ESAVGEQLFKLLGERPKVLRAVAPLRRKGALDLTSGRSELYRQIRPALAIDSQRRSHEIAPDRRRNRSAADPAERAVVVAAGPHADHQVAGKSDEQGVAILLCRAGLAEGRNSERGPAPGSVVGRG